MAYLDDGPRSRLAATFPGPAPSAVPAAAAVPATHAPGPDQPFLSRSTLPRLLTWRSAIVVSFGGAVLIAVSMGPMAAELGSLSILVWIAAAAIGAVQARLLAELSSRFNDRAGGTAQFGYRARPAGSPLLGALSSWSYWFAWTPGIAVNLILAGSYLHAVVLPGVAPVALAGVIGLLLYLANSRGVRLSMRISAVLAVMAAIPLLAVGLAPLLAPGSFDLGRIFPLDTAPGVEVAGLGVAALFVKWLFVAAWSAYGAEMASTLCAEVRNCGCDMPRALGIASVIFLISFGLVPIGMIGLIGIERLQEESIVAFVPAAETIFGAAGETVIGLLLAAALILGAQAFILGSSRTIYALASDGHMPRFFRRVNRRGVPVGSLAWDAFIITIVLAVFGTNVVDAVAAANVGYLVVFIIMPLAYLVLRKRADGDPDGLRLPHVFRWVAIGLVVVNAFILVVGGVQWGLEVMLVGFGVTSLIVPLSILSRRVQRRWGETAATARSAG